MNLVSLELYGIFLRGHQAEVCSAFLIFI